MNIHMENKRILSYYFLIWGMAVGLGDLYAQEREWEIDRIKRENQQREKILDSLLVHVEDAWEIKVSYGRWNFIGGATSSDDALFTLPNSMNRWQLGAVWHFHEKLFVDFSIGVQLKRDAPSTPNIGSILNGDDIELEGSGALFLPIDIGLNYYLSTHRFRPFIGIGTGAVLVRSTYIVAEGNISTGITRTDVTSQERVRTGDISAGFDYRLGKNTNFSFNSSYVVSGKFSESIGGFTRYQGLDIQAGFSVVLFSERKKDK